MKIRQGDDSWYIGGVLPTFRGVLTTLCKTYPGWEEVYVANTCSQICPCFVNNRNASAELRFDALVEKLQAGGINYKASDDLPYGKEWNNGGSYTAGLSAINWAIATLPEIRLGHTFEIPFANANGAVITPDKCRAFGRSVAAARRAFLVE